MSPGHRIAPRTLRPRVSVLLVAAMIGALAISFGTVSASQAAKTTVTASADAYVMSSRPTRSAGSSRSLRVDGAPAIVRSFVTFDLSEFSGELESAKLQVLARSTTRQTSVVSSVSPEWTEDSLTWATAPAPGASLATIAGIRSGRWVSADVTRGTQLGGKVSFVIWSHGRTAQAFTSRETATPPRLELNLASGTTSVPSDSGTPKNDQSTTPTTTPSDSQSPESVASENSTGGDLAFPIRAAFYYPWFPEAWKQGGVQPYTNFTPTAGYYGSDATQTDRHIAQMQYAGLSAGISSWWGVDSKEDRRVPLLLSRAAETGFRWSLYYEPEGQGDPSSAQITSDLAHIRSSYASDPSFARVGGKALIFVYADGGDACDMADRWKAADTSGFFVVLKVFRGYKTCASQPSSWHQYGPAVARDHQSGYSYAVSPGFWLKNAPERLGRDLARFRRDVQAMADSGEPVQLVTTYNEWGEATSVEPATEWASASGYGDYLDALHEILGPAPGTVESTTGESEPNSDASTTSSAPTSSTTTTEPVDTSSSTTTTTTSPATSSSTPPAPSGSAPVLAAVGDIACDPAAGKFNGGAGTSTSCRQMATSDLVVQRGADAVAALGDIQYEDASLANFQASYDPSWGRLKSITRPAVGNHEYLTAGAKDYYTYFGAAAGDPAKGYYSYDLGAWHIVVLNSNCGEVGGCGAGSPQERWLRADLAAHSNQVCTAAYWHHPRWSGGEHGDHSSVGALYQALYDNKAEVVLSGHDHTYERFAERAPDGSSASGRGIRQFVVGTGGKNHYAMTTGPYTQAANDDTFGVLFLTLKPTAYAWEFVPEAGKTFTDSGSTSCR